MISLDIEFCSLNFSLINADNDWWAQNQFSISLLLGWVSAIPRNRRELSVIEPSRSCSDMIWSALSSVQLSIKLKPICCNWIGTSWFNSNRWKMFVIMRHKKRATRISFQLRHVPWHCFVRCGTRARSLGRYRMSAASNIKRMEIMFTKFDRLSDARVDRKCW